MDVTAPSSRAPTGLASDGAASRRPPPLAVLLLASGLVFALVAAGLLVSRARAPFRADLLRPLSHAEMERGFALYRTHCAGCHGVFLAGAEGWRDTPGAAPALNETGHAHRHGDLELLGRVALGVRRADGEITMPAFGRTLAGDDMVVLLSYVAAWWSPEQVRARSADGPLAAALCTPEEAGGTPADRAPQ